MNFCLLFREANFLHNGYIAHFLSERDEIWQHWGLANRNLFPEFHEHWSEDPVIPFGDMHQSFTSTLVTWFFDN